MTVTIVSADVDPARESDLSAAYQSVTSQPIPAGLLSSALLRGPAGLWQIITVWRDRSALEAMRASTETPAAIAVFRAAGASPSVTVLDVVESLIADAHTA